MSELDTRDFSKLNESQLFLIEFYSVLGAWVMMLVMLMVERLGLAVMTSRLVAEMGSWGQESCQSLHTSVPPASSPQGQSSLDNASSVIRTRLMRADSSTMAIRSDQTLSHCHTVTPHWSGQAIFIINFIAVCYQLGSECFHKSNISCCQDRFLPGKKCQLNNFYLN